MVKDSVTTVYTYNADNQLLTEISPDANATYAYDDNGNLLSKTDACDAGNNATYTWDWRNRLVEVFEADGNTVYEYDGNGDRIAKTVGGTRTKYINDPAMGFVQVLMETDNANVIQATYNYGHDLIAMDRAGTVSYYHYDGLGTVKQLTDSAGDVVASYTYDAFGNSVASESSVANAYGFTREQQFAEVDKLVYLRERYYDSSIGRFLQRDPSGYELNVYAYCLNNPTNYIDPKGLACYKLNIELTDISINSVKTTGLCPPFTEIAVEIFAAGFIKGKFPIHKEDDTCPPCYHCDWWKPGEGTVSVELKKYKINVPIGIKCILHVSATLKMKTFLQFGFCKKDNGKCCP